MADVWTVCSLVPFEINEDKPGLFPPRYHIDASDGKNPEILHVRTAVHYVYLDESRGSLQVRDAASEVAKSIVQDYCNAQLGANDGAGPGMFCLEGELDEDDIPQNLITSFRAKQMKWFLNLCKIADDDWNKYHQHNVISEFQRTAAHIIGWKPEQHLWMSPIITESVQMTKCQWCGASVDPTVAICSNCKNVVNKSLHEELVKQYA